MHPPLGGRWHCIPHDPSTSCANCGRECLCGLSAARFTTLYRRGGAGGKRVVDAFPKYVARGPGPGAPRAGPDGTSCCATSGHRPDGVLSYRRHQFSNVASMVSRRGARTRQPTSPCTGARPGRSRPCPAEQKRSPHDAPEPQSCPGRHPDQRRRDRPPGPDPRPGHRDRRRPPGLPRARATAPAGPRRAAPGRWRRSRSCRWLPPGLRIISFPTTGPRACRGSPTTGTGSAIRTRTRSSAWTACPPPTTPAVRPGRRRPAPRPPPPLPQGPGRGCHVHRRQRPRRPVRRRRHRWPPLAAALTRVPDAVDVPLPRTAPVRGSFPL